MSENTTSNFNWVDTVFKIAVGIFIAVAVMLLLKQCYGMKSIEAQPYSINIDSGKIPNQVKSDELHVLRVIDSLNKISASKQLKIDLLEISYKGKVAENKVLYSRLQDLPFIDSVDFHEYANRSQSINIDCDSTKRVYEEKLKIEKEKFVADSIAKLKLKLNFDTLLLQRDTLLKNNEILVGKVNKKNKNGIVKDIIIAILLAISIAK